MILEDFFTLSEMKDGLGTANRVKELISVMREQKDCSASNITDAFRQWSTVAKILATTESKDCLECFIQFDGLWYLNYWLQEAQKHGSDGCDDSVSKLINYILGAIDRLPINKEVSVSSQLGLTLRQVISETDVFLKEKGRKLLGKWEFTGEEIKDQGHEKHGSWHIVELKVSAGLMEEGVQAMKATSSPHSISSSKVAVDGGLCCRQSADKFDHMDEKTCQLSAEVVGTSNMDNSASNRQSQQSASNSGGATVVSGDINSLASSNVSNPCQVSMSIAEESSACFVVGTSSGMVNSFAVEKIVQSDFSDIKDMSNILKDDEMYMHRAETNFFKSKSKEESVTSCPSLSSSTRNIVPISTELCTLGSKETENSSVNVCDSELKTVTVDERFPTCSKTRKEENTSSGKSDGQLEAACEDSCGETSGGTKKVSSSFLKADKELDLRKQYRYNNVFTRRAEVELEFGDDALEVAVQVAIEAEREVADREHCSSSSQEGKSDGEVVDSGCSGPEANKSDQSNSCLCPSNLDHSDGNSSPGKKSSCTGGGSKIDQTARGHDSESPLSTSMIQRSLENTKESRCLFDLNEGVDSEDANHSPLPAHQNLSAPVAVVATTRGSPTLPVMRPHFNGESGWKGSAATSAFRPASPKKAPEYRQISSNNEECNLLEFDLNVADHGNDVIPGPIFTKSLPMSEPNSRSSPLEISSKREERVILDLNSPGDENVSPEASSYMSHHDQKSENGTGNQLPPSSRLAKCASFRDIDLNDTPAFDVSDPPSTIKTSSKASSTSESRDLGDPDVVILGSRMSNVRRDPFNHSWHSSTRGFHTEPSMGVRASPMVYPYMPANGYGYNGVGMGPHTMALHPSPYGPGSLPYMVDSRGTTVIPHILGSSTGFAGPPAPRPFLIAAAGNTLGVGIASNSLGSGASGSPRPLMDLNSETFSYDSSREYGSFGNSYVQGHSGWTEEQVKHGPHSINGSGMGLKRKEPDPNWESHTIAYKHMPSWH